MPADQSNMASSVSAMEVTDPLLAPTAFGRQMRDAHFLFAPSYNPLNHGSFGTYPKYVQKRLRECQALSEARPDSFVRYEIPNMLEKSRAAIASYLGVPKDETVLLPNTTTATNVVLRNLKFEEGDAVIHLSTIYGAADKTLESIMETTPVRSVNVPVQYPISDDDLVESFKGSIKTAIEDGQKVRIAVFDTISSMPGVRVPWERLVDVCKQEDVLSFVDGAHGVGHIKLDLAKAQPDFFVSNLHKWLFVPRASAVFYVPKRNQRLIRTSLPTSHGFDPIPRPGRPPIHNPLPPHKSKNPFVLLFDFVATLDVGPYLCVEHALEFREKVCGGEEKILNYCENIVHDAGQRVAGMFGTEVLDNEENTLTKCAFANVRLPLKIGIGKGEIPAEDAGTLERWMIFHLVKEYDTYAPVFVHANSFFMRFCGQIYLDIDDYKRGAQAVLELCWRAQVGEYVNELS